jgi:hypothetical protein
LLDGKSDQVHVAGIPEWPVMPDIAVTSSVAVLFPAHAKHASP